MNYRDRRLLDLAHRMEYCTLCLRPSPDGCEPAHENGAAGGKGMGIKAHDNRHAALCHSCHSWYDQGRAPRAEKQEAWCKAHLRTMDEYWRRGWIVVSGK